jgi:hypothetical protein
VRGRGGGGGGDGRGGGGGKFPSTLRIPPHPSHTTPSHTNTPPPAPTQGASDPPAWTRGVQRTLRQQALALGLEGGEENANPLARDPEDVRGDTGHMLGPCYAHAGPCYAVLCPRLPSQS